ncbi:hypothetical protein VNO78_25579 [Psophocarpus tetragonolobus]|uniref:Uncharacterized protein n=1 Tax=Psophocarpus tetragonolobus TaxID=3891 RepID=A0AAN9S7D6_PSOTE
MIDFGSGKVIVTGHFGVGDSQETDGDFMAILDIEAANSKIRVANLACGCWKSASELTIWTTVAGNQQVNCRFGLHTHILNEAQTTNVEGTNMPMEIGNPTGLWKLATQLTGLVNN